MLVGNGPLPRGDIVFELKNDGWRCTVGVDGPARRLRLETRTGRVVTPSVPELGPLADAVGERRMVLDAELIAGDGSPDSFYALAGRMAASTPLAVERARWAEPVSLVIFDVLWLDGASVVEAPYHERRSILEELHLQGPRWVTTPVYEDGDALLEACEAVGAEGIVAKSRHSLWRAQTRTAQWVKFKTPSWLRMHSPRRLPATGRTSGLL